MDGPLAEEGVPLAGPAVALSALCLAGAAALATATGGREIGDDAPRLVVLCRHAFALFGSYADVGLAVNFGSYPPLLPLLFGSLVRPWFELVSDFWAIRAGVLGWSLLTLASIVWVARSVGASRTETSRALWLFALLPSVWAAVALIPQEEAYVALFAVALYLAAAARRPVWVALGFMMTVAAGKYFLLVLALPLALACDRPVRSLVLYVAPSLLLLGAYVGYHALRFDHALPILGHETGVGAVTAWALANHLGFGVGPQWTKWISVPLTGLCVLTFCIAAQRRGLGLLASVAGSLYVVLLTLYLALPAYALWALPFMSVCAVRLRRPAHRVAAVALLLCWGIGEWGGNFFRGVALALAVERGEGKQAIAGLAERLLGAGFPFHDAYLVLTALVLASGIGLLVLVWQDSPNAARVAAPEPAGAET